MPACPICAGPAEVTGLAVSLRDWTCPGCGPFSISRGGELFLAQRRPDATGRRRAGAAVRAEHDALRLPVMVLASRLRDWLGERAPTAAPPDGLPDDLAPLAARNHALRQRAVRAWAEVTDQLDRLAAAEWRARDTIRSSKAREAASRLCLDGRTPRARPVAERGLAVPAGR